MVNSIQKIELFLTTGGILLKYDNKHRKYIDKIKKLFTLEYEDYNSVRVARGYRSYPDKNIILLAKFRFAELIKNGKAQILFKKIGINEKISISNTLGELSKFIYVSDINDYIWSGKANKYQKLVIDTIMTKYFSKTKIGRGKSGITLNLPTGHGKTYVAMALMNVLKCPTLIACNTIKIANQWYELLKKTYLKIKIGIYHSDNKIDGDIMVGVIDSLSLSNAFKFKNKEYNWKEFYNRWKFSIFDESHNYCTGKKSNIFRRISSVYTLGLSATPDQRVDGFDKISTWYIGPIITTDDISGYMELYENDTDIPIFNGTIKAIKYHATKQYAKQFYNDNGRINMHKTLHCIMNDPDRKKLIVNEIIRLINENHCILIFSSRISYLIELKKNLTVTNKEFENSIILDILDEEKLQILIGGSTDNEMNNAKKTSRVIFTTYPFFKEGISIPRITAIIYATPKKRGYEQTNGRCIRQTTIKELNEKNREIIDIIDWDIPVFKRQWYFRKDSHNKLCIDTGIIGTNFNMHSIHVYS